MPLACSTIADPYRFDALRRCGAHAHYHSWPADRLARAPWRRNLVVVTDIAPAGVFLVELVTRERVIIAR